MYNFRSANPAYNFSEPFSSSPSSSSFHDDSHKDCISKVMKMKPKVRIVHIFAPEIIKTDVKNFQQLVQRLTGNHATCSKDEGRRLHRRRTRKKIKMELVVDASKEEENQELLDASGTSTSKSATPPLVLQQAAARLEQIQEEDLKMSSIKAEKQITRELWNMKKEVEHEDEDDSGAAGDLFLNVDHFLFHGLDDIMPLILPMNPPQLDFVGDDQSPTFSFLPVR